MDNLGRNLAVVGAFAAGYRAALLAAGYAKLARDSIRSTMLQWGY